jgi:hypothetical protein
MCICWYEIKLSLKLKCTVNTILNKMDIKETGWEVVDCSHLAENRNKL